MAVLFGPSTWRGCSGDRTRRADVTTNADRSEQSETSLSRQRIGANLELDQVSFLHRPAFDVPRGVGAVGRVDARGPSSRRSDRRCGRPCPRLWNPIGYGTRIMTHCFVSGLNASSESEPEPLAIGVFAPRPSVLNWSTQL